MISIKKKRKIILVLILSVILALIIISISIFAYLPYGLHKKNMYKVRIPKDAIAYVSFESLKDSILKFSNSIYAYRISNDEAMYDFSIMIRSIDSFISKMRTNGSFFLKMLYKSIINRNSAILFWEYNNNLNNSEIFYIIDIGKLNSLLFNTFFNIKNIEIDNILYDIKRINYNNVKIYVLDNNGPKLFFTFYNGILILSKKFNHTKKILDFFESGYFDFYEMNLLKEAKNDYNPDISFYLNKELFDSNKIKDSLMFYILSYFEDAFHIYGNIKFYDDNGVADIFIDYEYGGSDKYSLYNLDEKIDICNYLSREKTIVYFDLKAYLSGLYPLTFNKLKDKKDDILYSKIYNLFTNMNYIYSFDSIINDLYGEIAISYVESTRSKLIYPVVIFNIKNNNSILPKFEIELLNKYPSLNKFEKKYNNYFIYSYNFNNAIFLYFTFINNIYFFSENEKAIETIIDNSYNNETLGNYINNKIDKKISPNYIFTVQPSKFQNIFKDFNINLKTWSYPNNLIITSTILSNYTHINLDFKANFKSK